MTNRTLGLRQRLAGLFSGAMRPDSRNAGSHRMLAVPPTRLPRQARVRARHRPEPVAGVLGVDRAERPGIFGCWLRTTSLIADLGTS